MGYTQDFSLSRASRNDKTKQIASQSTLFNLDSSPLNHEREGEHTHDIDDANRYTYQVPVSTSNSRVSNRDIREATKYVTNLASQGYNSTAYSKSGSKNKFKINLGNNNKPILDVRTGSRGAADAEATGVSDVDYAPVSRRDVKKMLKSTGSVSVVDGVVTTGTSSTKTKTGRVDWDNKKAEKALLVSNKRAEFAAKKQALLDARKR
tara:strand:- start:601 stop:1221 length:621 start_codon:yes stop_codon:yes gene_type:complete